MKDIPIIRVFVKGGLISPAELLQVMKASREAGNGYIMFGSRQDILFPVEPVKSAKAGVLLDQTGLAYHITESGRLKKPFKQENIVSSYVSVNVTDSTWWLKEDVYHYILDRFDYQPVFKVNIIDPIQSLVPLFTGHFNFVASRQEHYWHLYIRRNSSENSSTLIPWPDLIHENDIAAAAKHIEQVLQESPGLSHRELYKKVDSEVKLHSVASDEKPSKPTSLFPYYEGLNTMQNNDLWLGLYWRNNRFGIEFLSEACRLCQQTRVGKISITPWKSFIIKGIRSDDRILWEKLMGRYGINLRHSSLELNWHLPVMDEEALELKTYLVRELDQKDISTHGLTFTVKTDPDMLLFTSVVIERDFGEKGPEGELLYNILYARNFNPNSSEYLTFDEKVMKTDLPTLLIDLSKTYFNELESGFEPGSHRTAVENEEKPVYSSYQCRNCMTIYDSEYGDPQAGIKEGTLFENLPGNYVCSVCTTPKTSFIPVEEY